MKQRVLAGSGSATLRTFIKRSRVHDICCKASPVCHDYLMCLRGQIDDLPCPPVSHRPGPAAYASAPEKPSQLMLTTKLSSFKGTVSREKLLN